MTQMVIVSVVFGLFDIVVWFVLHVFHSKEVSKLNGTYSTSLNNNAYGSHLSQSLNQATEL